MKLNTAYHLKINDEMSVHILVGRPFTLTSLIQSIYALIFFSKAIISFDHAVEILSVINIRYVVVDFSFLKPFPLAEILNGSLAQLTYSPYIHNFNYTYCLAFPCPCPD